MERKEQEEKERKEEELRRQEEQLRREKEEFEREKEEIRRQKEELEIKQKLELQVNACCSNSFSFGNICFNIVVFFF